jgi:thiol-disulfide isomerase/thioredoxin
MKTITHKLFTLLFIPLMLFGFFRPVEAVLADDYIPSLHFFWSIGCPHCAKEKQFLPKLQQKYPQLNIIDYELSQNRDNQRLMERVGRLMNIDVSGVPVTIVGGEYIIGYQDDSTSGKRLEVMVEKAVVQRSADIVKEIIKGDEEIKAKKYEINIPEEINVPLFGKIKLKEMSLPVLTVVLAFLDGFNPCAMWVLVFLISLLLPLHNRKKMFVFGSVFILTSGFVYFLFLSAWLNLFLFIGFVFWIRLLIGVLAVMAGFYNLREYVINPSGACKVTGGANKKHVFEKIKGLIHMQNLLLSLAGIIALAVAVNLVELVCSAGLPAIYTQVLSLSNLPLWKYYSYLILYIFIFMLDDLLVFFAAMATMQLSGINSKYSRLSHLIGGIIMFLIGLILLIRPQLLMFG